MRSLFDFEAIRALIESGFTLRFDAMHAVTGPYARAILEEALGAPAGSVVNATPLPDFGGGHPDPNPVYAKELVDLLMGATAPDFGAAPAGDGAPNMLLARGIYVTPSPSLPVLTDTPPLPPPYTSRATRVPRTIPPTPPPPR